MLWLVTAGRTSSIQIKVRNSRAAAFTGVLANNDIAISMDGKGAWRTTCSSSGYGAAFKYAEVHLRAYDSVGEARASIGRYLDFYNAGDRIRALTARHPIKPTSPRCQSGWQPNPGRRSTYRRGKKFRQPGPPQGTLGTSDRAAKKRYGTNFARGASLPSGG